MLSGYICDLPGLTEVIAENIDNLYGMIAFCEQKLLKYSTVIDLLNVMGPIAILGEDASDEQRESTIDKQFTQLAKLLNEFMEKKYFDLLETVSVKLELPNLVIQLNMYAEIKKQIAAEQQQQQQQQQQPEVVIKASNNSNYHQERFFSKATGMEVGGKHLTDNAMADFYRKLSHQ